MPETTTDSLRNRIAYRLASLVLRLATREYRDTVAAFMAYGMDAAARDREEGRDPPASWRGENPYA